MTYLSTITSWFAAALNSAFSIALVGGFVGAVGGALGAQHIAERTRRREELLRELRNTNAATLVSFSICNAALALKKQHVQPMHGLFMKEKEALDLFKAKRAKGEVPPNAEHGVTADLRTFPAPKTPIETLKGLVFEKISAYGRVLAAVAALDQALVGLADAIARRDAWARRFSSGAIPPQQFQHYYFGLTLPDGNTNQEYPDLIEAINGYTDDVAFFSFLLCADLIKHGAAVRAALIKRSEKNVPNVSTVDFTGPRASGLIPPNEEYSAWLNGFKEQEAVNETKQPTRQGGSIGWFRLLWGRRSPRTLDSTA